MNIFQEEKKIIIDICKNNKHFKLLNNFKREIELYDIKVEFNICEENHKQYYEFIIYRLDKLHIRIKEKKFINSELYSIINYLLS